MEHGTLIIENFLFARNRIPTFQFHYLYPAMSQRPWQARLHDVIYESNTPAGKAFDVALLALIVTSILVVTLDSVPLWHERYGHIFLVMEWIFTILFTIEYILRLICLRQPLRYVFSFVGIIDLLAIVPSYLSIFLDRKSTRLNSSHSQISYA